MWMWGSNQFIRVSGGLPSRARGPAGGEDYGAKGGTAGGGWRFCCPRVHPRPMPTPADADPVELLSLHRERVRRLIARLVAPHDAADVEQEVWLAALERPPRHAAALPSWIAT